MADSCCSQLLTLSQQAQAKSCALNDITPQPQRKKDPSCHDHDFANIAPSTSQQAIACSSLTSSPSYQVACPVLEAARLRCACRAAKLNSSALQVCRAQHCHSANVTVYRMYMLCIRSGQCSENYHGLYRWSGVSQRAVSMAAQDLRVGRTHWHSGSPRHVTACTFRDSCVAIPAIVRQQTDSSQRLVSLVKPHALAVDWQTRSRAQC